MSDGPLRLIRKWQDIARDAHLVSVSMLSSSKVADSHGLFFDRRKLISDAIYWQERAAVYARLALAEMTITHGLDGHDGN